MRERTVSALRKAAVGIGVIFAVILLSSYVVFRQDLYEYSINPRKPFEVEQRSDPPNYKDRANWAAFPTEADADKPVDVFYLHPTTFISSDSWNGRLQGRERTRVEKIMVPGQASLFMAQGRVYAPVYRQATLYAFFTRSLDSSRARAFAYGDVSLAFEEFLNVREPDRPFILAAHGQGAFHATRLIMDYIQDSSVEDDFVVAYLVGAPVPVNLFQQGLESTPPCTRSDQIGCIASWNVFFDGGDPREFLKHSLYWRYAELLPGENEQILCVNPLTWSADGRVANASENAGAVPLTQRGRNKRPLVINAVGAQCQNGILYTDRPTARVLRQSPFEGDRPHHLADFNLFYEDVRQNVATRVDAHRAHAAERARTSGILR